VNLKVAIPCRQTSAAPAPDRAAGLTATDDLTVILPPHPPQQPHPPAHEADKKLLAALLDTIAGRVAELRGREEQRLRELRRLAVELAVAVASVVLHQRLERGEFAVESLVHKIVLKLAPRTAVRVYLHPQDQTLLAERCAQLDLPDLANMEVEILPDAALCRGDCRAETGELTLMWDAQEQLAAIRDRLLAAIREIEPIEPVPGEREPALTRHGDVHVI